MIKNVLRFAKFSYITLLSVAFFPQLSYSEDQFSLQFQMNSGLTGLSKDTTTTKIQPDDLDDTSIEIQYDFNSSSNSFFTSLGYSNQSRGYVLYPMGNSGDVDSYKVKYSNFFIKGGYDFHFSDLRLKPSVKLGNGNYEFSGDNSVDESSNAMLIGFELNVQGTIFDSSAYYLFGIGYSSANFEKVGSIDGFDAVSDMPSINIGLGYSF